MAHGTCDKGGTGILPVSSTPAGDMDASDHRQDADATSRIFLFTSPSAQGPGRKGVPKTRLTPT